ncbi:hypothetical protein QPK32_17690 [Massilia sp. YIM B02763]|nr:hypothetical protein [Massilia sp. YIM B02763]MDN4054916.1 hypothetical protein [Massilia sp. YIM B02763]
MNLVLGLRTLALLAVVALATVALVHPGLVGAGAAPDPAFYAMPVIGHH